MPPLVSVLIPCRNAVQYIGKAVESALRQTYPDVEIVVVDDGSTDGSLEIIKSFGNRIRWKSGPAKGACSARNMALELSNGEYIQFLDADDLLVPDKLAIQVPYLSEDLADVVFSSGKIIDGETNEVRPIQYHLPSPDGWDAFEYCLTFATSGFSIEGPLHRRTLLEQIGGFRDHLTRYQDCDLHIRLGAMNVRLQMVDQSLFYVRDHSGPRITSSLNNRLSYLDVLLELKELLDLAPFTMTPARANALAKVIFEHSVMAYRNKSRSLAEQGFAAAAEMSSTFASHSRFPYRMSVQLFGPMIAERVRAFVLGLNPIGR